MQDESTTLSILDILAIVSPIVAVLISIWINEWLNTRRVVKLRKDDVLKNLIESRYNTGSHDFIKAMNAIPVVFRDHKSVRDKQDKLYKKIIEENRSGKPGGEERDNLMVELITEICHQLGYSNKITKEDIKNVFKF